MRPTDPPWHPIPADRVAALRVGLYVNVTALEERLTVIDGRRYCEIRVAR